MIKKHEDIMQALRADNYAPIYVLCGEEPYYTDKVFDFIAANALDEMHASLTNRSSMGVTCRELISLRSLAQHAVLL